eukprot:1158387-Pelagomonas_calceolata.AAC.3
MQAVAAGKAHSKTLCQSSSPLQARLCGLQVTATGGKKVESLCRLLLGLCAIRKGHDFPPFKSQPLLLVIYLFFLESIIVSRVRMGKEVSNAPSRSSKEPQTRPLIIFLALFASLLHPIKYSLLDGRKAAGVFPSFLLLLVAGCYCTAPRPGQRMTMNSDHSIGKSCGLSRKR